MTNTSAADMNQTTNYFSTLKPLDQSGAQIRLLTIHAAQQSDAPIECTVFVASLLDQDTHATLSYTWGDPSVTSPIFVNGVEENVALNLKAALRRLRNTGAAEKPLWIDALCINQKDIQDKNVQIMCMPKIYENAYLTLVWLGEEEQDSKSAMKNIRLVGDIEMKHAVKNNNVIERSTEDVLNELENCAEFDLWNEQNILAFASLFTRPWWQRRWIVQEVALSKRILMICGDEIVPWEHFVSTSLVLTWIRKRWAQSTCQPHRSHIAGFVLKAQISCLRLQTIREKKPYATLLELLSICRDCKESDARDAIYGVLSLATYSSGYIPDYRNTTRDVYFEFALNELTQSCSLAILQHCFFSQTSADDALPSWVPDWRIKEKWKLPTSFNAAGNATAPFTISKTENTLRVRTVVFGKISKSYQIPSALLDNSGNLEWMELILNQGGYRERSSKWIHKILRAITFDQLSVEKTLSDNSTSDVHILAGFLDFLEKNCISIDMVWEGITEAEKTPENITKLSEAFHTRATFANRFSFLDMLDRIKARRIIRTENGFLGIAPPNVLQQDLICIIAGCETPFIIRKFDRGSLLISQCFVVDAMHSEVLDEVACGNMQWEQLDLV